MPPAMDADLDDGELQMLAQMNLDERGGDSYRTSKVDPLDGDSSRPRSSSLPSPGKSLWSSWLGWGAGQSLTTLTATARPYKYKPLLNKGDFRLLSVSKSGMDDQLYFQMTRQRMDDCPEYEAISYTWGSTECTEPIFHAFSGEVLFITKNCASALQNIHTNSERRLWIDAICINQNDIEERNVQVSMMADVFRNANRTIAYVGDSDPHSVYLTLSPAERNTMRVTDHRLDFLTPSSYEYLHVDAVASRPWFSRTWVIQEVLLSKNLSMQAGKDVMDFQEICGILRKHGTDPNKWVPGITNTFIRYGSESQVKTRLLKHFAARSPGPSSPDLSSKEYSSKGYLKYWQLFNLLFETAPYQCRDARDKLFALTSLFDGDPPEELRPDYSLDTGEVYANISRFLIMSETLTLALSAAHGVGSASDIPSWAIDWRDAPSFKALTQGKMGDRTQYSAGFLSGQHHLAAARHQQHVPVLPSIGKVLRLRGLRAGVIYEPMHANLKPKISWLDHSKDMFYRAEPVESESWSLPKTIRSGDVIVVLFGFEVPFVLRASRSRWLLIGECDVEDIMYGQALTGLGLAWNQIDSARPRSPLEDFDII